MALHLAQNRLVPSSMLIRDANGSDAEYIAKVYLDSYLRAYAGIVTDISLKKRNISNCTEQWKRNVADEACTVLVAESEGKILGVASFGASRDDDANAALIAEVQAIYVSPNYWGSGVGWRLCQHAMDTIYHAGYAAVTLWVLTENQRAIEFYQRAGFVTDGMVKSVTMDTKLTAVRYRHVRKKAT